MTALVLVVVGLGAGALASALGVGGGIVFVPALVVVLGFDQTLAEGTSLAVIVLTATIATWTHHRHDRVDWRVAALVAAGAVVGAVGGSSLALRLHPEVLQRLFAVFLVIVAVRMIRQLGR
jgi:uncharacterized membrane protein YfcA